MMHNGTVGVTRQLLQPTGARDTVRRGTRHAGSG
jgi:hypothetical protein